MCMSSRARVHVDLSAKILWTGYYNINARLFKAAAPMCILVKFDANWHDYYLGFYALLCEQSTLR
jgi:hypothetical protein